MLILMVSWTDIILELSTFSSTFDFLPTIRVIYRTFRIFRTARFLKLIKVQCISVEPFIPDLLDIKKLGSWEEAQNLVDRNFLLGYTHF